MRSEDGQIIRECLDGDSASFGLLVDKYKASIYALAYSRLHNFHDAEDIAQEVFLKAYKNLHTLRRWDSFFVWIRSIAINLCKNRIRTQARRPDSEPMDDQEKLEEVSANLYRDEQSSVVRHEALDSLNRALESLPETYQQVLTLHYLGKMSGQQMSQFLGISHASVRQRLSRARRQLREEVIAMMSSTYEQQRLQASFTFRIVEAVKRIKINPMPRIAALPWGLSLAAGIIFTVMSLSSHLNTLNPIAVSAGLPLPTKTEALKAGEIRVDILDTSQMSDMAGKGADLGQAPERPVPMRALAPPDEEGKWEKKADMPAARVAHSASVVDGKIYIIGGADGQQDILSTEVYDPATGKWSKKADMPTTRERPSASAVDGKIYVFGGFTPNRKVATVEIYDPATDTWSKGVDMPTARGGLASGVVNGRIYVIGGYDAADDALSTVEEYDTGFVLEGRPVEPNGKLPTTWGTVKRQ